MSGGHSKRRFHPQNEAAVGTIGSGQDDLDDAWAGGNCNGCYGQKSSIPKGPCSCQTAPANAR